MTPSSRDMMDTDDGIEFGKENVINREDDQEPGLCEVLLPQASMPSVLFLLIARIIIVVWGLCVVALLVDVVIFDRISQPCKMPWE